VNPKEKRLAGRDRLTAVKRARERQALIEAATLRVTRAQARAERARVAKERAVAAADERIAGAEAAVAAELQALVAACGSIGYVAEILQLDHRVIRRMASKRSTQTVDQAGHDAPLDGPTDGDRREGRTSQ
jgi:hypothetical protein